jgi:hypothetical protein
MDPFTIMMFASAGLGAFGQIMGGKNQKFAAEMDAYNAETEAILVRAQGIEQGNLLAEEFKETMSSANALFMGAMGRDLSDRSLEAYKNKEMYTLGKDIDNTSLMSSLEELKLKQQAASDRLRGKNAMMSATIGATRTLLKAGLDYGDVK